jgi:hypothetical protein
MAESGDAYRRFIDVAKAVGHARLRVRRTHSDAVRRELESLLDSVCNNLQTERSVSAIEEAWSNLDGVVSSLLRRELSLISSVHGEGESKDENEDIATGKESLEDILGVWLPDPIKHLLKILNEILKLVK